MRRARRFLVWVITYLIVAYQVQEGVLHVFGESLWATLGAVIVGIFAGWIVADAVEEAEICRQASR